MKPYHITCQNVGNLRRAELMVYGIIGQENTARDFAKELSRLGQLDLIEVRINSPGGSFTEGLGMASILERNSARVITHIDGVAFSMASALAQVGDKRTMAADGLMMIHESSLPAGGMIDRTEAQRISDSLVRTNANLVSIYARRSGIAPEQVRAMMAQETWFTADEALQAGLIDEISQPLRAAANYGGFVPPQRLSPAATLQHVPQGNLTMLTVDQIYAVCPGASPEFVINQMQIPHNTIQAVQAAFASQQPPPLPQQQFGFPAANVAPAAVQPANVGLVQSQLTQPAPQVPQAGLFPQYPQANGAPQPMPQLPAQPLAQPAPQPWPIVQQPMPQPQPQPQPPVAQQPQPQPQYYAPPVQQLPAQPLAAAPQLPIQAPAQGPPQLSVFPPAQQPAPGLGVAPVQAQAAVAGMLQIDPIAAYNAEIDRKVNVNGMSRSEAGLAVAKENPELRQAYVARYNQLHPPRPSQSAM